MRKIAVEKAKKRMVEAGDFFHALDGHMPFEQFEQRWSAFLTAINRAFLALSAGAHDNAKTRAWWSKKKHEWKRDPLLQYLRQARNTDEHGLDALAHLVPGYFSTTVPAGIDPTSVFHYKLIPVCNFGIVFDPPTEHLGQKISSGEIGLPWYTAVRALAYYNTLVMEAESYVT